MKHIPVIGFSELTGRVYIITSFNRDGSARTKFDVTENFLKVRQQYRRRQERKRPPSPSAEGHAAEGRKDEKA